MRIKTQNEAAPAFVKIDKQISIEYKSKSGEFVLKDVTDGWKEVARVKSLEIVPIANERFTLSNVDWQSDDFTGTYRSPKQTITVMNNGQVSFSGTYEEAKATNKFHYTKVMHLVVKVDGEWKTAEFKYKGVGVQMMGDLDLEQEGILELKSEDTATFESKAGKLFSLEVSHLSEETPDVFDLSEEYAINVKASYDSEDIRYKHFKESKSEVIDLESTTEPEEVDIDSLDDEF